MSFDSFTLRILVSELRDALLGGRIRHVAQTNSFEIILRISTESDNRDLLISAHPTYARTHLVKQSPKTKKRFHFADFLMQHIMRGTISKSVLIEFLKFQLPQPSLCLRLSQNC